MAIRIDITPVMPADEAELREQIRNDDAEEVEAAGFDLSEAIRWSCLRAESWAVRVNGELLGIYGIMQLSLVPDHARPWCLTTKLVDRRPKTFYKLSKILFQQLQEQHPQMSLYIDQRYTKAIRWAESLGFKVGETVAVGRQGRPFVHVATGGV